MSSNVRNFALWVIIVLLMMALFTLFQNPGQRQSEPTISYSQLLSEVDRGRVRDVSLQGSEVRGAFTDGRRFHAVIPVANDPALVARLQSKGVSISVEQPADKVPWFVSLLVSWLPFIALIGVWIFLSRRTQSGMTFGPQAEIEALRRQVADLQRQIDEMKKGGR